MAVLNKEGLIDLALDYFSENKVLLGNPVYSTLVNFRLN